MRRRIGTAIILALATVSTATADNAASMVGGVSGLTGMSGGDIYSRICQGCHMPEGQGAAGAGHYPKLAADPALAAWQYVALVVLNGKHGMPAFGVPARQRGEAPGRHLSDAQVAEIVNYVRGHFGNHFKNSVTEHEVAGLPHPESAPPLGPE